MPGSFVHLHCHSHYSLLDGANRIPELVKHVKQAGMNSVALTDHGNLYGAIEFYTECKSGGINPIIGYEAYVAPNKRTERGDAKRRGDAGFHLTLLAQNRTGFQNLIKMASAAYLEGYYYVPRIDKELLAAHSEGLICLSGCASSEFSEFILKEQMAEARKLAEWFAKTFGKNFYVEIQDNGLDIQRRCKDGAVEIANKLGLPLVATSDAHYLNSDDAGAHDVLLCINTGRLRSDENRMKYGSNLFHVRKPEEMYDLFPGFEAAVGRSQEIANGVDIQLDLKARHFPVFTPPEKKTVEDYLRELCAKGLEKRYGGKTPEEQKAAQDRMAHELGIICRMGFASYFLIVWDFVRFAREQKIPATARGSACGALVSYVLELSHVCPLEYDLLFERFLDPNRSEAPDIDIDFCQDRREDVIAYVRKKYGEASVAQIGTFGTMAARAAVKDVGRVLDVPLERVNALTKLIPTTLGITLDEALQQNPELKKEYDTDATTKELIDIARKLEGTNRNAGTHAAGVVISNGPLTDYVPLQRVLRKGTAFEARPAADENGTVKNGAPRPKPTGEPTVQITTQWEMTALEKIGLLKMDFLGLRTLTLLDHCIDIIQKTRGKKVTEPTRDGKLDLYRLPMAADHPKVQETYKLLQRGLARGVFQLESDGIRELLKRMKPDNIRDLIAIMALYRPGPLQGGMVDAYVNRKHGREKPTYPHPVMEEILTETYGVMVYQEQIMRILNRLGGIELSKAYACIKAISKKKQEIIDERKAEFIKGSLERGVSQETSKEIFELITFFGGYGFNKCVVGDTTIINAHTGERTTVEALFNAPRDFHIHAKGDDGKLRPRRVTDVMANGVKPVYRLRTAQGKEIVATGNHPFWTVDGWKNLEDLKAGDRVGAARRLEIFRSPEGAADDSPGRSRRSRQALGAIAPHSTKPCKGGRDWLRTQPLSPLQGFHFNQHPHPRACQLRWLRPGLSSAAPSGLRNEPESDVVWDRIVAIEPASRQPTYDLTVDVDHNFVADGLIVHNSHTAAYAQVGYQTAYLKANYTPEFFAALLSSEIDDGNKRDIMVEHIEEARRDFKLDIMAPNVNTDDVVFTVEEGKVLFGLTAIKGVGRGAAAEVVRARDEKGPFTDLFDFCERIDQKIVTRAAIEKLIKAGALDCFRARRAQLMAGLQAALQSANDMQRDKQRGQLSLFDAPAAGADDGVVATAVLPDVPEWPPIEKLKYEKEALDFYFSSHPLAQYEDDLRLAPNRLAQLADMGPHQEVMIGGIITLVRFQNTKKARNGNTRYFRCKLEDMTGSAECVMWPDDFAKCKDDIAEDKVCYVKGTVERNRDEPGLVLTRVLTVEQGKKELARNARGLCLFLSLVEHSPEVVNHVAPVLQGAPGQCPVWMEITDMAGKKARLRAGTEFSVNPVHVDVGRLESILGKGRARLVW